jgi:hypothetical protein
MTGPRELAFLKDFVADIGSIFFGSVDCNMSNGKLSFNWLTSCFKMNIECQTKKGCV